MALITIKTFENAIEAEMLKVKFASEGIDSYLFDENVTTLIPHLNLAIGGIKLKIDARDFNKVTQLIDEVYNSALTDDNGEHVHCPKCNSSDIYNFKSFKNPKGIIALIMSFFTVTLPIYHKQIHKCNTCNFEF
jgi:hypothetical protein